VQNDPQPATQPVQLREYNFRAGKSGNPSGVTVTMRRTAELRAMFVEMRGREPNAIEAITLREAGALAARIERKTSTNDEIAKLGNVLRRTLRRVGLDTPAPSPRPTRPSAFELLGDDK
jgi:hypothetical protein